MVVLMGGVNERLLSEAAAVAKGAETALAKQGGVSLLVEKWGALNLMRTVLALVAGGLGLYGAL